MRKRREEESTPSAALSAKTSMDRDGVPPSSGQRASRPGMNQCSGSARGSGRIPGGRGVGARRPECVSSPASSSSVVFFCPRGASFFAAPHHGCDAGLRPPLPGPSEPRVATTSAGVVQATAWRLQCEQHQPCRPLESCTVTHKRNASELRHRGVCVGGGEGGRGRGRGRGRGEVVVVGCVGGGERGVKNLIVKSKEYRGSIVILCDGMSALFKTHESSTFVVKLKIPVHFTCTLSHAPYVHDCADTPNPSVTL